MAKTVYDESSIEVLEGLECVRKKPAMYIGDLTNGNGIFHILKEVLDNALDEAMNGYSDIVGCRITNDYIEVYDTGRGIPVGKLKDSNKSALEVIMTKLHAGGKISQNSNAYKQSVGTHGVGVSCTNALSEWFKVFTFRDKKWYSQSYSKGVPTSEVIKEQPGDSYKKGTVIRFKPDKTILKGELNVKIVEDWMETSSFLNSGIIFRFDTSDGYTVDYKSNGLVDYINKITNSIQDGSFEAIREPFVIKTDNVDLILQWFETDKSDFKSWCNSSLTIEGGTHLNAVYQMITREFSEYAKKKDFKPEDLRAGLFGALNIKIPSPQFDSQTKEKLISPEATNIINNQVTESFKKYLKNKSFVKRILSRAAELRTIYNKFNQEKKALSKLKTRGKLNLPPAAKFAISNTKEASERELYIVEGLSAGGTAKSARNPAFQEILMLKGKILNTERKNMSTAFESDDVLNILKAVGFDPDSKEHCLRVGKIIILTDADVDGCLDGDTHVLTIDHKNPTIRELAEEWSKAKKPEPFYVYATTPDGHIEVTEAINPRKTRTVDEYIELEFSDGEKIKCTTDHKWLLYRPYKYDPKVIWEGEYGYKLAKDLSHIDIIAGVSVLEKCPFSKFLKNKRVIKETKDVYCLTVPKYHNFMVSDASNNPFGICSSNSHISTLLLTLFQNLYPEVLEKNMVYVVDAPLFIGKTKTSEIYAESLDELKTLAEKAGKKLETVTRAKGWGEINAPLLRKLAFDKSTRKIKLITPSVGENLKIFKQIVGDDVTLRKKILSEI